MRLLLTSDWQTEMNNIDLCETALSELLDYAQQFQPDAIIHGGDLKEHYSDPAILRVVKFWVRAVRTIKRAGYRFIILKGNHDRLSQVEGQDWLDILRAAGAETVSNPKTKEVGDGIVSLLPYTSDKVQEKLWAEQLLNSTIRASRNQRKRTVLVFHTEVQGARLNSAGILTRGVNPSLLHLDRYDACFGGHIHEFQKISGTENSWYIGSPFCMSWGEADQKKGFILYED